LNQQGGEDNETENHPGRASGLRRPVAAAFACEVTLKSSDTHPDGYPTVAAVKKMGELLKERTGGRICVEVFHSAQLGEEKDTIEQTKFGVIDLNRVSMGPFNNIIEETKVVSLPFIFRSVDHMHRVMDGPIGPRSWPPSSRTALSAWPIMTAAAAASTTRRSPSVDRGPRRHEGPRHAVRRLRRHDDRLGANATPMPYGEVYSAIQTGVIDGAENNWPSFESSGHLRGRGLLHAERAPDRARSAGDVQGQLGQADARGSGAPAPGRAGLDAGQPRALGRAREGIRGKGPRRGRARSSTTSTRPRSSRRWCRSTKSTPTRRSCRTS
jgi:hypothetical protein